MGVTRSLLALAAAGALACAGAARPPPPPTGTDDASAREVLRRFVVALDAGRFEEAQALLSARWRQPYTPGRGARTAEVEGEPARVNRLLAAGEPLVHGPGTARLPVGAGRAATVVAEPGGWRVDALE